MAKGWISVHRQIWDSWIWNEKPFSKGQAWIDLILLVNHEDKNIPFDNQVVSVRRGSTVTSIRKLSERWGWSAKKVSGFLNVLEQDKMLEQKRTTRCTTLTIVKYSDYQDRGNTKAPLKNHSSITQASLRNTNNNDITMINKKNKKDMPSAEIEIPEGATLLPDGTLSYSNVKREW